MFLCTGNSCRSQMAEGFAKFYLKKYIISSAGTNPEKINQSAIKVMEKIGIDMSSHYSKKINNDELSKFDLIITLCGDAKDNCPIISDNKHIHWEIEDPAKYKEDKEGSIKKYSMIRDLIIDKIKLLKNDLEKDN